MNRDNWTTATVTLEIVFLAILAGLLSMAGYNYSSHPKCQDGYVAVRTYTETPLCVQGIKAE